MLSPVDSFLMEFKAHPEFKALIKHIDNSVPLVPDWKPGEDVENWKYQSALREGYFLALTHFKISENKK